MDAYELWVATEFARIEGEVGRFFMDISVDCPYGMPHQALFHQACFAPLPAEVLELFLAKGYRRNGDSLYSMRCKECSACQPIRLEAMDFRANRSQRRNWKKNSDIEVSWSPVVADPEHLELCERFLAVRYPSENSAKRYYEEFFCNQLGHSAQLDFRQNGRLLGSSIIDYGENWLNAVYFFFDPDEGKRGLGTYNILALNQICCQQQKRFLYLGYYIDTVAAMSYKHNFIPYQLLGADGWREYAARPSQR